MLGSIVGGVYPGLALKAWAVVRWNGAAAPTLIKGANIASVARSNVGILVVTFTTPFLSVDQVTDYAIEGVGGAVGSTQHTTGNGTVVVLVAGAQSDGFSGIYVGFYE